MKRDLIGLLLLALIIAMMVICSGIDLDQDLGKARSDHSTVRVAKF